MVQTATCQEKCFNFNQATGRRQSSRERNNIWWGRGIEAGHQRGFKRCNCKTGCANNSYASTLRSAKCHDNHAGQH